MSGIPSSKVLLPLYIYPHPGAWDPLLMALTRYPQIQFLIIANPNNGPGYEPWWPNADYVRELSRLNAFPNVTIVGYVHATYCQRALKEVLKDVETYARRQEQRETTDRLGDWSMGGIFVDETVNLYSSENKGWLDAVDREVKSCRAFGNDAVTIHNPGTAVNAELAKPGPDITVVVETSYEVFVTGKYQEWLATSPYDRSRSCYMLHAVPQDKVEALTKSLRKRAEYLFVTSATAAFYEGWDQKWEDFIAAMAAA